MMDKNYDDPLEHVDINALADAMANNGVLTGLTISAAGSNMSVDVAAGSCRISAVTYTEVGSTNLVIEAAHATLNRRDIIIYDVATTNPAIVKGTAAGDPEPPDITSGDILLGIVYVDAAVTVIGTSDVRDSGVTVKSDNGIRDAVEAATDSNTFTDADHTKLNNIEDYLFVKCTYGLDNAELHNNAPEKTTTSNTYAKIKSITLGNTVPDTIRIKFTQLCDTDTMYGRIYRNGVAVGVERPSTWGVTLSSTEDIAGWSSGDNVELYVHASAGLTSKGWDLKVLGVYTYQSRLQTTESEITYTNNDP